MKTIIKPGMYRIVKLFYDNRNSPLHLREIARRAKLNESAASRNLNFLTKEGVLIFQKEANLKKFSMERKKMPIYFPSFDHERLEALPLLRKNAIKEYLIQTQKKPSLAVVFGSTSKGTHKADSDVDILEVRNKKINNDEAKKKAESLTGMRIQIFQVEESDFQRELVEKKDNVIQSALHTGFPIFNLEYFYEVIFP